MLPLSIISLTLNGVGDVAKKTVQPHEVPEQPIDAYSYDKGVFIDIRSAKQLNGWKVVEDWMPTVKGNTRKGFVHVPMLVADRASASLSFSFEGRAVGDLLCSRSASLRIGI